VRAPEGQTISRQDEDKLIFEELMTRQYGGPGSGKAWRKIDIDIKQLYELARMGCTQAEAAQFFGICQTGFEGRLQKDEDLRKAWDLGSAQAKISLRRLQIAHASTPGAPGVQMAIHLSKYWLGERDEAVKVTGNDGGPIKVSFSFDTPATRAALNDGANDEAA
jgi:hypothetical protein